MKEAAFFFNQTTMKKLSLLIIVVTLFVLAGCQNTNNQKNNKTSKPAITQIISIQAEELPMAMDSVDELQVKLTGTIVEVCQSSGCWMDIDMGDGKRVLATFSPDVFVAPKDAAGKQATVEGTATKVIIPVKRLQLQAADEGASEEEINAITEPVAEYSIEAVKVEIGDGGVTE